MELIKHEDTNQQRIVLTKEEALRLLKKNENDKALYEKLGFDIMCQEYGDDEDWCGVYSEDYETLQDPEYVHFEIWEGERCTQLFSDINEYLNKPNKIMEQKLARVSFNLELAKKITNKEIEGRIITRDKRSARIVCFDVMDKKCPIIALVKGKFNETPNLYCADGKFSLKGESDLDLMLEIPEYMTFKDGDIIYCEVDNGGGDYCKWISILDGTVDTTLSLNFHAYATYITDASKDAGAVLFDDYSDNIGLIRLATEEERQRLIDALKASKDPQAKEYLKRFFEIEEKPKYEFKPFDKVLVKNDENEEWNISLFAREIMNYSDGLTYEYECCNGILWNYCIPFEGNEHLLADKIITD